MTDVVTGAVTVGSIWDSRMWMEEGITTPFALMQEGRSAPSSFRYKAAKSNFNGWSFTSRMARIRMFQFVTEFRPEAEHALLIYQAINAESEASKFGTARIIGDAVAQV
jgi:hypothetical protein